MMTKLSILWKEVIYPHVRNVPQVYLQTQALIEQHNNGIVNHIEVFFRLIEGDTVSCHLGGGQEILVFLCERSAVGNSKNNLSNIIWEGLWDQPRSLCGIFQVVSLSNCF